MSNSKYFKELEIEQTSSIKEIKKGARPSKETPRVNEEIYRQIQAL